MRPTFDVGSLLKARLSGADWIFLLILFLINGFLIYFICYFSLGLPDSDREIFLMNPSQTYWLHSLMSVIVAWLFSIVLIIIYWLIKKYVVLGKFQNHNKKICQNKMLKIAIYSLVVAFIESHLILLHKLYVYGFV